MPSLTRMSQTIKSVTIPSVEEDVGKVKPSYITGENAQWYSHFGKRFGRFLKS